ncbi:unnamed protein product [Macrosiphum euphorbiae]|uniref:Uncharacterized protein n=1 Tax=Macrosiphum euphorbiae TaxID=13131 RepID=A0AAV0WP18_9HEMI|nr:unnamed protein product [Macrosiphum euphorbiae]
MEKTDRKNHLIRQQLLYSRLTYYYYGSWVGGGARVTSHFPGKSQFTRRKTVTIGSERIERIMEKNRDLRETYSPHRMPLMRYSILGDFLL